MTHSGHRGVYTSNMGKLQSISWPRIIAEGVAIVASILIAFSIDAWWTERQAREQERNVLTNLLGEFTRLENAETRASKRKR